MEGAASESSSFSWSQAVVDSVDDKKDRWVPYNVLDRNKHVDKVEL